MIAAIKTIKDRNSTVPDSSQRDYVSVVTFDTVSGTVVRQGLTSNYDTAMTSCTTLQAVGDDQYSTATETGLIAAMNLIDTPANGGPAARTRRRSSCC